MAAILFGLALRRTALEQPVVPAKSLSREKFYRLLPMLVTAVLAGLLSVLGFANNTVTFGIGVRELVVYLDAKRETK